MPDLCIEVWNRFRRASGSSPSLRLTNAKTSSPIILTLGEASPNPNEIIAQDVPHTNGHGIL